MTWVVDTCVILDILDGKSEFAEKSSQALQSKMDWVQHDFRGSEAAVLSAHRAWYEHVLRKRKGEATKRPIADVMIGAYALQKGGLITRNEDDFRSLYPTLNIYNPVKASI